MSCTLLWQPWPREAVAKKRRENHGRLAWSCLISLLLQVLRWFGFYKESIPNSPVENHRIRKVVVHYYLDNDTLDVVEPKEPNSGLPQVLPPKLQQASALASTAKPGSLRTTPVANRAKASSTVKAFVTLGVDADGFAECRLPQLPKKQLSQSYLTIDTL